MILLLRLFIFLLFIFLIYSAIRFIKSPRRKLKLALEQKKFYILDDTANVRKNFLLTYHGILFEGEKYAEVINNSFEVVSIIVWPKNITALHGLDRDDFLKLESFIKARYPIAQIDWKSPVKELLEL
ncbi:sigma-w pathway protein ysdB [Peribacillus cavernae]|uniref:Sigma-w pathway protein ysdB n=1 Tax=Peribacillus cavernae TaxID=1674310 RepID=A0A433HAZ4_9BACI|nr:sigma-w pathway protein ysdB [Peribacillus cavernae]MDQ0220108.1 hypothetical protein [Peribacillus cavernae]RUQ25468.1 sigma-w pathway protein ysdB [Peribacillus cavernae]